MQQPEISIHPLIGRFFPYLVEINTLKLYNTFKIYLPRGIFIWTNLLSYLTQPMD